MDNSLYYYLNKLSVYYYLFHLLFKTGKLEFVILQSDNAVK